MARKTKDVAIPPDGGRDAGKTFRLTEMPAASAEKWAARAFLALAHAGVQVPENIVDAGIVGLATMAFSALAGLRFEEAEPLMDEMMRCVQLVPLGSTPDFARALNDDDIEEVATRVMLRGELFTLHTGFTLADATSRLNSMRPRAPA